MKLRAESQDLQQSDEPEAAMSLMTRMVTIDESMFISLFPFVAEDTETRRCRGGTFHDKTSITATKTKITVINN